MTQQDNRSRDNRSSAEIEREVEANRAGLRATLDELRGRMTPGQVLDEAWQFARDGSGGDYVRNLGSSMKTNPLPVALIGAGIAWLMSGRGGGISNRSRFVREDEDLYPSGSIYPSARNRFPNVGRVERRPRGTSAGDALTSLAVDGHEEPQDSEGSGFLDKARSAVEGARDAVSDTVSGASDSLSGVGDRMSDGAGRAADNLRHARDYAGERASAFGDYASERASALGERASSFGDYASERASSFGRDVSQRGRSFGRSALETGRDARQRAANLADEQPLVLALAGLALGAVIGAAVRSTSTEGRLMGDASDRVKAQAKGMVQDGVIETAAVVERTFEAVKEEAKEQGLTTADAASAAETVTERVKKVAEKGKAKLREEIGAAGADATASKPAAGDAV
jgi:hypothetical protein